MVLIDYLGRENYPVWKKKLLHYTTILAKTKMIYPKNVGAQVAIDFT